MRVRIEEVTARGGEVGLLFDLDGLTPVTEITQCWHRRYPSLFTMLNYRYGQDRRHAIQFHVTAPRPLIY